MQEANPLSADAQLAHESARPYSSAAEQGKNYVSKASQDVKNEFIATTKSSFVATR